MLTRFLCSGKENTVFTDTKDRQVKHYYPKKKVASGSYQQILAKKILMAQRDQHLSFKYMEFILTRNHFAFDVAVLTIETIKLVLKPVFLKQFHFFKPLDIFMKLLK